MIFAALIIVASVAVVTLLAVVLARWAIKQVFGLVGLTGIGGGEA